MGGPAVMRGYVVGIHRNACTGQNKRQGPSQSWHGTETRVFRTQGAGHLLVDASSSLKDCSSFKKRLCSATIKCFTSPIAGSVLLSIGHIQLDILVLE